MAIPDIGFRGARPLRESDNLVGRDRELNELCNRCESYDIVQITAPSGVGKTSFVMAGGRRALEERGFFVPPLRAWSSWLGHPSLRDRRGTPAEFAEVLYRLLIGVPESELEPDDRHVGDVVESVADGRKMVVMLDQMEELLRFQEAVGNALLRLAGEAAKDSSVPHVVIARSEYRERLHPVEVRGAKVWNLFIRDITSPTAIEQIIRGPVENAKVVIDDDAVKKIRSWWDTARGRILRASGLGTGDALGAVGLLHLQSLLWSFEQWARHADGFVTISVEALDAFAVSRGVACGFDPANDELAGASLIEDALFNYVDDRVTQATVRPTVKRREAERELDWRNGPRVMLARVAPALSSGGYKVPQALSSLMPLALRDELTPRGARNLADALRAGKDISGYAQATRLQSAGLAAGWDRHRLLTELVDGLESILQALSDEEANILRKFNVTDESVYELVHDGIGPALTRWSLEFLDRPISAVGVIAAQPGGTFQHNLSPSTFLDEDGVVEPHWGAVKIEHGPHGGPIAVLDNLQWASNVVNASEGSPALTLCDLRFRRCDFTGAAFVGCDFKNVSFEHCCFKGAVMIACSFDEVRFTPAADAGDELNLLTIKSPTVASSVRFEGLAGTTGLFLEELSGGEWILKDCTLSHLVATAKDATTDAVVRLEGTQASHVTIESPVTVESDAQSELLYCESLGV